MVGQACGVEGIRPGTYCEPKMTTVGSQDTTGPMTRDELQDLACLGFSADLTMQSFCHTAAYPKPVDIDTQHSLPDFIMTRGRRLPATRRRHHPQLAEPHVAPGYGGHGRRLPYPLSYGHLVSRRIRAGGLRSGDRGYALGHARIRSGPFKGEMQPGVTLRDLVHAIPYYAIQQGLLTVEKKGKKNIFSGKILKSRDWKR